MCTIRHDYIYCRLYKVQCILDICRLHIVDLVKDSVYHSCTFCTYCRSCKGQCIPFMYILLSTKCTWSSGGRVVKLLACGARGPGFRFLASPLKFPEIGYLLLPSHDMAEIPLKQRKSSKQPTNQPIPKCNRHVHVQ